MNGRRRIDILQNEADHGRLSPLALSVGRETQLALEGVERTGSGCWGERVDGSRDADAGAVSAVEAARRSARALSRIEHVVGVDAVPVVLAVLGENLPFSEVAARQGRAGRRATSDVAARFRHALEQLALARKAVGAASTKVVDKHSQAAASIFSRMKADRAA